MAERFSHLAGAVALDVLNTVDWRLAPDRREDRLTGIEAVLAWGREADLIHASEHAELSARAEQEPRRAETAARQFCEAREDAYLALIERDPAAVDRLSNRQQEACAAAVLVSADDGAWQWRDRQLTLQTPLHRVVRALIELMRSNQIGRLHQCEDEACGWVYLDTSPRRNRRWCAAADCGDRNRARDYYRRKTASM